MRACLIGSCPRKDAIFWITAIPSNQSFCETYDALRSLGKRENSGDVGQFCIWELGYAYRGAKALLKCSRAGGVHRRRRPVVLACSVRERADQMVAPERGRRAVP